MQKLDVKKKKVKSLWLVMLLHVVFLTACVSTEKQTEDITNISQTRESESKEDNIKEDKTEEDKIKEETEGMEQKETEISKKSEVQIAISDFSKPQESQTYSPVPAVQQAAASQDEKIQHIRDIYNRTMREVTGSLEDAIIQQMECWLKP